MALKNILVKIWNKSFDLLQEGKSKAREHWDLLIVSKYRPVPRVMSIEETLDTIKSSYCSISRFGDGEIKLIAGKSLAFQPFSEELKDNLKNVISAQMPGLLVCLPDIFDRLDGFTPEAATHWRRHLSYYRKWWSRSAGYSRWLYGNSFITRCYMMYQDKNRADSCFAGIRQLWRGRHILLVEGEQSRLGVGNDLFSEALSMKRILAPNRDAFRFRNEILEEVRKYDAVSYLVLLALGPTATVLAYDLTKQGYQALDIGHLDIEYEWCRMKATHKVPVKGKYVNEAGGAPQEQISDKQYASEIVCRFQV